MPGLGPDAQCREALGAEQLDNELAGHPVIGKPVTPEQQRIRDA